MTEGIGRADRAEASDAVAFAAHMWPEAAMHGNTGHGVARALTGVVARVVPNGRGAEFMMTFYQPPGVTAAVFEGQIALVGDNSQR